MDKSSSQDEFTRLTAIKWLKEFVAIAPQQLVPQYAEIIGAVLPNISHSSKDIQQVGAGTLYHCTSVGMCHAVAHAPWSLPGLPCCQEQLHHMHCLCTQRGLLPYRHSACCSTIHVYRCTVCDAGGWQSHLHSHLLLQISREANHALLELQPGDEGGTAVDTAAVLAVISRELRSEQEPTRLEALRWISFLLVGGGRGSCGLVGCCSAVCLPQQHQGVVLLVLLQWILHSAPADKPSASWPVSVGSGECSVHSWLWRTCIEAGTCRRKLCQPDGQACLAQLWALMWHVASLL